MSQKKYRRLTFELTVHFATVVQRQSPQATFCYVSGAGTDTTESGRLMWARVKGETENHLLKMPFPKAFMFRPGFMKATRGQQNTPGFYPFVNWAFPLFRAIFPKFVCELKEVGKAMVNVSQTGYSKAILEVADIVKASKIK